MKKKKKRNYYNLIVHAIRIFSIMGCVTGFSLIFVTDEKYTRYLIIMLFYFFCPNVYLYNIS